jgi:hypothetical protein
VVTDFLTEPLTALENGHLHAAREGTAKRREFGRDFHRTMRLVAYHPSG